MLKRIRKRLKSSGCVSGFKEKGSSFFSGYDRAMEAITFAEAGAHDHALSALEKQVSPRKIVVVSAGELFEPYLVEYAVSLAKRIGHEILAISVDPGKTLSAKVEKRFEKAAMAFEKVAVENGISFDHMIMMGKIDKLFMRIEKEIKRVDMVVTGPDLKRACRFAESNLPVFTLLPEKGTY